MQPLGMRVYLAAFSISCPRFWGDPVCSRHKTSSGESPTM